MKFTISLILTMLLSAAICLYFPWWTIAIVAFFVAVVIPQKAGWAFVSAFTTLTLIWGGLSFYISSNNNHILVHKVSMIILKMDNPLVLFTATAMIGGLVAGFAAMSGSYLRKIIK